MRASTALCVLLGAAVLVSSAHATSSEGKAPERKKGYLQMFGSPSSYYYDRTDVKHMRLSQTAWGVRPIGCENMERCNGNNTACEDCFSEYMIRSELACCQEEGEEESVVSMGPPKVGQCDWHFAFYQCPDGYADAGACGAGDSDDLAPGFIETGSNPYTEQIGSAWGTCYLNSDSETCGEPFCGQMVISIQGTVHRVEAYGQNNSTGGGYLDGDWAPPQSITGRFAGKSVLSKKMKSDDSASMKQAPSAKRNTEPTEGGKTYSLGLATVITGPVNVLATGRSFEYTHGMLEYVLMFTPYPLTTPVSHCPYSAYCYTPYTYNIALAASGGSSYDSYGDKNDYEPKYEGHKEHDYKYYDHHAQRKH